MNHQERLEQAAKTLCTNWITCRYHEVHIEEVKRIFDAYLGDTVLYRLQCNMPSKVAKHYEPCYVRVWPTGDNE